MKSHVVMNENNTRCNTATTKCHLARQYVIFAQPWTKPQQHYNNWSRILWLWLCSGLVLVQNKVWIFSIWKLYLIHLWGHNQCIVSGCFGLWTQHPTLQHNTLQYNVVSNLRYIVTIICLIFIDVLCVICFVSVHI